MKRFALSAVALLVTGGLAFAQTPAPTKPAIPAKPAAIRSKTFSGKIQSVTEADAAKGTKSEISVVGDDAAAKVFLVKAGTTIYAPNGQPLALKDLKAENSVKVSYKTSPEGVLEALAIYQKK
ncbi:MAG: hypothetical protein HGA80_05225 [Candidatus Omnitrophica bacterium]|nr:hypothetical protein [Candidatus Omnitrophota bacterium]